jgi:NAD(P)-binding Rossmann-like domain
VEEQSPPITIIGGGVAGLVAAIAAAEAGRPVRLFEKRSELGGRARSSRGEFVANFGPHALYADGAAWAWLRTRGLLPPAKRAPVRGLIFKWRSRAHRLPPREMRRGLRRIRRREPPVDTSFYDWAKALAGEEAAGLLAAACVNVTFDHDPGRWSAAFIHERLARIFRPRPPVRYVIGGWGQLVARLEARARALEIEIRLGTEVGVLPEAPAVVATELHEARHLLADDSLRWHGTRAVLLDVGLARQRGDPAVVFDLDAPALLERFSIVEGTVAPKGYDLVQAHMGLRPGEDPDEGAHRLEAVFDASYPAWRERQVWGRRMVVEGRTGALDPPGTTWRDRPQPNRGAGIFVVGDMMAAPGMLSEVALSSALEASAAALTWNAGQSASPRGSPPPGVGSQ